METFEAKVESLQNNLASQLIAIERVVNNLTQAKQQANERMHEIKQWAADKFIYIQSHENIMRGTTGEEQASHLVSVLKYYCDNMENNREIILRCECGVANQRQRQREIRFTLKDYSKILDVNN